MMHMVWIFPYFNKQPNIFKKIYLKGRQYPFDVTGKAFSSLPFQDKNNNNLLTNFDILYDLITYQVAGFSKSGAHSDPGIYVCSTGIEI